MSELLEKIINRGKEKESKGIYCKKCDVWFPDRKEFGKHLAKEHNHKAPASKRFKIPKELVEETKFMSDGSHLKIEVLGILKGDNIEVNSFKYV